jgi:hypothetical protein
MKSRKQKLSPPERDANPQEEEGILVDPQEEESTNQQQDQSLKEENPEQRQQVAVNFIQIDEGTKAEAIQSISRILSIEKLSFDQKISEKDEELRKGKEIVRAFIFTAILSLGRRESIRSPTSEPHPWRRFAIRI